MVADIKPGHGSLGGIFTGLNCCSSRYGFIFACDMPFLNQEVISYICKRSWGHDITIPRIGGYLEPLHAVYSTRCIPFIEKLMQRGHLKIKKLFNEVDMLEIEQQELATIDPCLQFHINVNTPADLDKAMEMVRTNSPAFLKKQVSEISIRRARTVSDVRLEQIGQSCPQCNRKQFFRGIDRLYQCVA